MKLDEQEEELADIKLEKDNLIKNQNELKKKRKDDQVKFREEMEELKSQHDVRVGHKAILFIHYLLFNSYCFQRLRKASCLSFQEDHKS